MKRILLMLVCWLCLAAIGCRKPSNPVEKKAEPSIGVPDVQVPLTTLHPSATIELGGNPDWMAVTENAVWVSNSRLKGVQRISPLTNKVIATVHFPSPPCSGLTFSFGSLWVPLCGNPPRLARVNARMNRITATLRVGPADSEGGITSNSNSVWLVTNKNGTLVRINPKTNSVRQKISIPHGSFNPLFSDGIIWITGFDTNVLTAVDALSGKMIASIPVGPKPRFLTVGDGSIWTLNQGDGSVTRVDISSNRAVATIAANIPGEGGEICFGAGSVWATLFKAPLTRIDANLNRVIRQWTGPGGDSVRFGHDSIWLTDYKRGLLWRIPQDQGLDKRLH